MEVEKAFFAPAFLTEFIKKFRSLSCLWKVKSSDYFNSTRRQKGWEELRDFCMKINPKVDIKWVKKKVQKIRSSFRSELKKVTASQKSRVEYKPKLWYFELLFFTKDDEIRESITSIDSGDDEAACAADEEQDVQVEDSKATLKLNDEDKSTKLEVLNLCGLEKKTAISLKRKNHDIKPGDEERRTLLLKRIRIELERQDQDDEYEATGKVVAAKLRKIANTDYRQFIYVDKIINDTLYKALLCQLTPADVIIMSENKSQIPLVPIYNVASSSSSSRSSLHSPPRPLLKVLLPEFQ